MLDAAVDERVSCALACDETSFALARTRDARCCCFACGGAFSVRMGDFRRCSACRAENYCPRMDVPAEERARRWWQRAAVHDRARSAKSEASVS